MLKLFTIIFSATFICCNVSAQSAIINSLKKILPSLKSKERIDCLNELAFEYSNIHFNKSHYVQTDSALVYINQAINEAEKFNYATGIGEALGNLGTVYEQRGNYLKGRRIYSPSDFNT